ncbi:MAG TPA: hypothetical protein VII08_19230 [Myxococcales bacterium]
MTQKVHHVIHVGKMEQTWDQDVVKASAIMTRANFIPPEGFVLEALTHPNGDVVKDFQPNDDVDFRDEKLKFFNVIPGGSGRS